MFALRTSPAGFPMAPSVEEWEALSPAEREAVVAALPGEVTYDEMAMPEGDRHAKAKARALDALRGFFTRQSRVLDLEIQVDEDRPRFYAGTALLLESEELIARVQAMYDAAQRCAEEEAHRREEAERLREEAERLRDEEARRREEAEREVARLRAELERLKR